MSERCSCGQPSKGTVGMLRLCYGCAANISKLSTRWLRHRIVIQLMRGTRPMGLTEWVPDAAISRERRRRA